MGDRVVVGEQHDRGLRRAPAGVAVGRQPRALPARPANRVGAAGGDLLHGGEVGLGGVHRQHDLEVAGAAGPGGRSRRGRGAAPGACRSSRARRSAVGRAPADCSLSPCRWRSTPQREERELREYLGERVRALAPAAVRAHPGRRVRRLRRRGALLPQLGGLPLQPHRVRDDPDQAALPRAADLTGAARRAGPGLRLRHRLRRPGPDRGRLPGGVRRLRQPQHRVPALAAEHGAGSTRRCTTSIARCPAASTPPSPST